MSNCWPAMAMVIVGLAWTAVLRADEVRVHLSPAPPPPYVGGEKVTVTVSLESVDAPDILIRLFQLDFTDTVSQLLLESKFTFAYPGLFSSILYTEFPNLKTPTTVYTALTPVEGFIVHLPPGETRVVGTIGVTLTTQSGSFVFDVLNADEPDLQKGARLDFGFEAPQTYRAYTGELTGGKMVFTILPADCNGNGVSDDLDILNGTSQDCNGNGKPDECETDCNGNGLHDLCDVALGISKDCNKNQIPDECEIADGTAADCPGGFGNGIPDGCEPDCNENGIADSCDIELGISEDCNGNGVPDECEGAVLFSAASETFSPFGFGAPQGFLVSGLPPVVSDATIELTASADLSSPAEFVSVTLNGTTVGTAFVSGAHDCPFEPDVQTVVVPEELFVSLVASGSAEVVVFASSAVSAGLCAPSFIMLEIRYRTPTDADADHNGVLDECEPIAIVDSDPPDGAIDARQPFGPFGGGPQGWDSILLVFSGDTAALQADDFDVYQIGGEEPPPTIEAVELLSSRTARLIFENALQPVAWTTVVHLPSGTEATLGFLPGDVNGDGTAAVPDVLALLDAINGVIVLPPYATDIDRSGITGPPDVLRVIDLLNGAGTYPVYNGVSLP